MKQILYFIIIGSIISSCSNKKEPDLSQAKSIELQGEIIKSDSDIFIANTDYLQVLDDKIYIYNPIGDFGFIVYDPKNQTYEYLTSDYWLEYYVYEDVTIVSVYDYSAMAELPETYMEAYNELFLIVLKINKKYAEYTNTKEGICNV